MPFRTKIRKVVPVLVSMLALNGTLYGQGGFEPQGGEYSVSGVLPGDQVHSDLALGEDGGYVVWQDNHTDGDGAGISARRLNSSSTAVYDPFRINSIGQGEQERPRIARLTGGNHLIVWQGGPAAKQGIFGRPIDAEGVFLSPQEIQINTHSTTAKMSPVVAGLSGGNAVVVWGSFGQDDASNADRVKQNLQGVYAQVLSPSGEFVGGEFQVNQAVEFNQHNPSVSGFGNNEFVVVWSTESVVGSGNNQRVTGVNILARIYSGSTLQPLSGEFQVNTSTNLCSNPSVVSTGDSGFTVAWSERRIEDAENSWDIAVRHFTSSAATAGQPQQILNTHTYGDQYAPRIAGKGNDQLVVWTSLGQDGSHEGIYGRFVSLGQVAGDEFRVNSETVSKQTLPSVSSLSANSMLVAWSSFVGGVGSVDLQAQRYSISIPRPGAPVVSASSSYSLFIAWPEVAGFDVAEYQLFVDQSVTPVSTIENFQRVSGLNPGTTHTFRLAYQLGDGRISPLSEEVSGSTFGADLNFDGLPDDWQAEQFGSNSAAWGGPLVDSDGDGVNNLNEFLAGTRAGDALSVLKIDISQSSQGWQLFWNSVPGLIYKVQASGDLSTWSEIGGYRFSAGSVDSTFVEPSGGMEYYRVIRIR